MDKKTIRITGAQCSFSVGAIQENKETILNCFEEAGFREISKDVPLQKYDLLFMNLTGEELNHCGVICDDFGNELLHHMKGRL